MYFFITTNGFCKVKIFNICCTRFLNRLINSIKPNYLFTIGNDFYVIAYQVDTSPSKIAVYKNGSYLYNIGEGIIVSAKVYNDDIYCMTSNYENMTQKSKLWKNQTLIKEKLGNVNGAPLTSFYIEGNDIYFGGRDVENGYNTKAVIWKNDELLMELTDGSKRCFVPQIEKRGADIYSIVGDQTSHHVYISKNKERQYTLPITTAVSFTKMILIKK